MKARLGYLLVVSLFVTGFFSSCKKQFTFTGTVADEFSNQGISNAVIRYLYNPQIYPFDDDSFEVVGSSGSDGHYAVDVQAEYNWGNLVAEHPSYWCARNFSTDEFDTIRLFRESWLKITLHDNPNLNFQGEVYCSVNRTIPTSSHWNVPWWEDISVTDYEYNASGDALCFRLAGDRENFIHLIMGMGSSYLLIDSIWPITPVWGDTAKIVVDY